MDTHGGNKVHNAIGGSVGIVGGLVLWINTHLGTAFYALLLLILLNVVAALWEKDLVKSFGKWLKVTMSVLIPTMIPELTRAQGIAWSDGDTKILVGTIFAALLSSTIPDLLAFINRFMSVWSIPRPTQQKVDTLTQAELEKFRSIFAGQQPVPYTPSNVVGISSDVTTTNATAEQPPTHGV